MKKSLSYPLILLFFFSGATSLVYETLWIRILSLGVGSTSSAMSMVLSIFFFGLSAGAYLSGKWAAKVDRPVFYYGLMEGLSGVFAILIIFPLLHFHGVLSLLPVGESFSTIGVIWKFFLVFIFLILPTLCMGATLPLLVRIYSCHTKQLGRSISFLYGVNTLGAVAGAFATSFWLIPTFGVLTSNFLTAGVSALVFIGSFFLSRSWKKTKPLVKATDVAKKVSFSLTPKNKAIIATAGICGFSAIACQVVWNKYLGIFFGTNIFGLGIILSMFLTGIALGSIILSTFIERVKNKELLFVSLLFAGTIAMLVTSRLFNITPVLTNVLGYYAGATFELLTIKTILSTLILFPTTLIFGALLPLAIRILSEDPHEAPYVTGVAYSINTIGSILGAYLTGLIFVPQLGSSTSLKIAISASLLAFVFVVFTLFTAQTRRVLAGSLAGLLAVISLTSNPLNFKNIIKSAYYQTVQEDLTFTEVMKYFSRDYEEFQFIHEGKTAIISLSHDPGDGDEYKDYLRLKTNGLNESIYYTKDRGLIPKYEGLLGFLPYLFTPNPESAFVVGYGGGFSVDFLTQTDLKTVKVAELEEGIIEAAQHAYNGKNPILTRKSLDLQIEDARFALAVHSGKPFDIILSQPSHSWLSGVANLFTQEFFEIVKSKLSKRGVFAQWLNLYNMDQEILKSILHTFYQTFPHGIVFTDANDDEVIMLGSASPIELDMEKLYALTENPRYRKILGELPLSTPADFLTNFSMSRERAFKLAENAPINTDINAHAEVQQSRIFYSASPSSPQEFFSDHYSSDLFEMTNLDPDQKDEFLASLLEAQSYQWKYDKFFNLLDHYSLNSKSQDKDLNLGNLCYQSERMACASHHLERVLAKAPTTATLNSALGARLEQGQLQEVIALSKNHNALLDSTSKCYVIEARVSLSQKIALSENQIQSNLNDCGAFFQKTLAKYYIQKQDFKKARLQLESYNQAQPGDIDVLRSLISVLVTLKDYPAFNDYVSSYKESVTQEKSRIEGLLATFQERGWDEDAKALQKKKNEIAGEI